MRLLVTGGAGFIGSNFVHHLLHARAGVGSACCPDQAKYPAPHDVPEMRILNVDKLTYAGNPAYLRGVDGPKHHSFAKVDITDAPAVEKAVKRFEPDGIVHFAAESHVDRSIDSGVEFANTNVLGTQVLLDAARRHDVPQFLHMSTDEVYGSIAAGSFTETDRLHASSPYSASKAAGDMFVLAHRHTYGVPVQIVRCTNNYGPRQHPEKLIPKTITHALHDKPIGVYATGQNVRDWLYVKDCCAGIETVLRLGTWDGSVWNIAAQDERRNLDVVKQILAEVGKPESLIEFVKDRPGHDFRYSLDDAKLRGLGWRPVMEFEEGLRHTIEWFTRPREAKTAAAKPSKKGAAKRHLQKVVAPRNARRSESSRRRGAVR